MLTLKHLISNRLAVAAATSLLSLSMGISTAQERHPAGPTVTGGAIVPEIELVQADAPSGFHHPYFLFVPRHVRPSAPVLLVTPTPPTSTNPADYLSAAQRIATNAVPLLRALEVPLLVPVLPRPPVELPDGHSIDLYVPALSRAALLAREPDLARMDLQVLAMLDHARQRLARDRHIKTDSRALFVGFSAGGHFATRMAMLHPDRVLAIWAGGTGGHPILPLQSLQGRRLTYPVGVGDLAEVAGHTFDAEAFARIPILVAQGTADTNSSLPLTSAPSDSYSSEQARLALDLLGSRALQRLDKVKALYASVTPKAQVRTYAGAPHRITADMLLDLVEFLQCEVVPTRR